VRKSREKRKRVRAPKRGKKGENKGRAKRRIEAIDPNFSEGRVLH